jgi:hypothetical protein
MWIGRLHLGVSIMEVGPIIFSTSRKLTPVSTRCWSMAGAAAIEIDATLLTVKLLG